MISDEIEEEEIYDIRHSTAAMHAFDFFFG